MEIREFLENCIEIVPAITQECENCHTTSNPIVYVGDSGQLIVSSIQFDQETRKMAMTFGSCETEKEVLDQIKNALRRCP